MCIGSCVVIHIVQTPGYIGNSIMSMRHTCTRETVSGSQISCSRFVDVNRLLRLRLEGKLPHSPLIRLGEILTLTQDA